ncbi:hypothetical protein CERSUDRAFT_100990 [Gelatoporia subvermispora B]|uniref:Uncharacterized protein n=1 Tax=Ceriporiopsis subvermispora (strain B) TaxID=914234 RepID=M2Q1U3_CERS8|nr:hypothetical protein CERSUDRAFT_100990 [Gelatoporia subvermispora B]
MRYSHSVPRPPGCRRRQPDLACAAAHLSDSAGRLSSGGRRLYALTELPPPAYDRLLPLPTRTLCAHFDAAASPAHTARSLYMRAVPAPEGRTVRDLLCLPPARRPHRHVLHDTENVHRHRVLNVSALNARRRTLEEETPDVPHQYSMPRRDRTAALVRAVGMRAARTLSASSSPPSRDHDTPARCSPFFFSRLFLSSFTSFCVWVSSPRSLAPIDIAPTTALPRSTRTSTTRQHDGDDEGIQHAEGIS